jgi:hypothetical protein
MQGRKVRPNTAEEDEELRRKRAAAVSEFFDFIFSRTVHRLALSRLALATHRNGTDTCIYLLLLYV